VASNPESRIVLFTPDAEAIDLTPASSLVLLGAHCSPDAMRCLYALTQSGAVHVYAVSISQALEVGEPEPLGEFTGSTLETDWANNSAWAAFVVRGASGTDAAYVWRPGQSPQQVPTVGRVPSSEFAPDGRGLLVTSVDSTVTPPAYMWSYAGHSANPTPTVFAEGSSLIAPKWSPSGDYFVRSRSSANDGTLVQVDAAGLPGAEVATPDFGASCSWTWLSPTQWVYDPCFASSDEQYTSTVVRASLMGGELSRQNLSMSVPITWTGINRKPLAHSGECLFFYDGVRVAAGKLTEAPVIKELFAPTLTRTTAYSAHETGVAFVNDYSVYWQPLEGCEVLGEPRLLATTSAFEPDLALMFGVNAQ
jgi:hypothetical protein